MTNRYETRRAAINNPDIVKHCHENFWQITCIDGCKHFEFCKSNDYPSGNFIQTFYPLDYIKVTKEKHDTIKR